MRVLVTGSRDWDRQDVVDGVLDIIAQNAAAIGDDEMVVVHGACFPRPRDGVLPKESADYLADLWVRRGGHPLPVRPERHPAKWSKYGRRAGPLRNEHMVSLGADVCVAFLRNNSEGTSGCMRLAERAEIHVQPLIYEELPPAGSLPERAS